MAYGGRVGFLLLARELQKAVEVLGLVDALGGSVDNCVAAYGRSRCGS